jgi:uncharacterized protein
LDPARFQADSFRRIDREHEGKKYSAIIGRLKGETTTTIQALRYPIESWTAAQAKSHCSSHDGIAFEAATGEEKSAPCGCHEAAVTRTAVGGVETRYLTAGGADLRLELREDDIRPRIVGYAAVFDSLSEDLGGFRERVRVGAFTRSLRDGADVRALVDHNPSEILGRVKSHTLTLRPTARGLLAYIDPPNTTRARDLMESIRRGDVDGMSFGFKTVADEWHSEDGVEVRDLTDVDLFDVSVVTFPAYPATEVGLRSLAAYRDRAKANWQADLDIRRRRLRQICS